MTLQVQAHGQQAQEAVICVMQGRTLVHISQLLWPLLAGVEMTKAARAMGPCRDRCRKCLRAHADRGPQKQLVLAAGPAGQAVAW